MIDLEALQDDTGELAGVGVATTDLIGPPPRITVGPRGLAGGKVELPDRRTSASEAMSPLATIALPGKSTARQIPMAKKREMRE